MIEFIHPALRNYRLELFEKLHKKYNMKFIFTLHTEGEDFGGINISSEWNFENIFLKGFLTSSGVYRKGSFINCLRFMRRLLTDDYDLMITGPLEMQYSLVSLMISRLRSKKIIIWGECWYLVEDTLYRKLYNKLMKSVLKKADACIASGEKPQEYYKKFFSGEVKVFNIRNYVVPYQPKDTSELITKLAEKDKNILNKKVVLYMSQIIRRKGLDYLIKAFKLLEDDLSNVYLLIAGSGPFEEHCKTLVDELGIKNVMFGGYVSDEEIELYHNICDVLVLPAIFYENCPEAIGYIICESMSIGKPLVVTDAVGAAPEYVQDGVNGFVVPEKNAEQLYEALAKILSNEEMAKEMGKRSKEIQKEKLSLDKQFEAFNTAIEYVMKK